MAIAVLCPAPTLGASGPHVVDLLENGQISLEVEGSGIQSVQVSIRRLVRNPTEVVIPVGTYFVSDRVGAQNMVATRELRFWLRDDRTVYVSVPAACANRPRDIPGPEDRFRVERSSHQAELTMVVKALDRRKASYPVRQAAVWIITDDATYEDMSILRASSYPGFGGSQVILPHHVTSAMNAIESAGIPIHLYRIYWDTPEVESEE